jgi:predicted ATPase
MRDDLPTGTVTFLFTDVEGSTKLLHLLGAEAYAEALAEHRRVIREACAAEGGVEVDTQGDAFFFAFPTGPGALAAAAALMEALAPGAIHVRLGLHTGTPLVTDEGYVGDDVHRAARIAAVGHGGQVLVAASTAALVAPDGLVDLGEHRFKDLAAPERIYQLGDEAFPPLKSLYRSNLPLAANPLVGRKKELADVLQALLDGSRAVTITGPGGVGKTRFALAVAGEAAHAFPDGVWFVPLASLRDPALVLPTVAAAIGADGDLAKHIGDGQCLLFLDNFEQVVDAALTLATLAGECPRLRFLVTSREALRIAVEREYPLSPLPESPSVELFRQRASAVAPELEVEYRTAAEICDRLDRLPLAIELAAARCKALSPEQILARVSESLDLLRGGRDADPRQHTLRATIEWSYNLLSDEEQRLFRALSIFRGGCALEAAEAVCDADLDTLQSLVEKSLLRFTRERYWMLETVREFARERLGEATENDRLARRHARHYLTRLEEIDPVLRGPRTGEFLAWYAAEEDNLRATLERLAAISHDDAARVAYLLSLYWVARGALDEGRDRVQGLLAIPSLDGLSRASLLQRLSDIEERLGNLDAAQTAGEEAVTLATTANAQAVLVDALWGLAWIADRREEFDDAIHLGSHALEEARSLDNARRLRCQTDLGSFLRSAGRDAEARAIFRESAEAYRQRGDAVNEAIVLSNLGSIDLTAGDYASAHDTYMLALERCRHLDDQFAASLAHVRPGLGQALLGLGRRDEARVLFASELSRTVSDDLTVDSALKPHLGVLLSGVALASRPEIYPQAARLRGAVVKLCDEGEFLHHEPFWNTLDKVLIDVLGQETWQQEQAAGAAMTLDETIALARSLADR